MSLALLFHYVLLNMLRMLYIHLQELATYCGFISCVVLLCKDGGFSISVLVQWRLISRDVCGCFNKRVSVNIGCCGLLWFLSSLVCSVFLIMFPEYILMSYLQVITYLVHVATNHSPLNKDANTKTSILTEQYNT